MQSEETLRWPAFLVASFALHAGALAWLDFSGGEIGRLPTTLTVLLESRGENDSSNVAPVPASAVRSRDLFDRPPAPPSASKPLETVKIAPEPLKSEQEPIRTASRPPAATAAEPAPPELDSGEPEDSRLKPAEVAAAESAPAPKGTSDRIGDHQGQLLSLLHQAISREKRYPMLARRQRREGTATVSFRLSPSGEMDAIGIDRSSGFSVLDTAAMSAVSRVAPFAPARVLLSDVTLFKVDVTFKLN